jgi:hypothetical protein
MEVLCLRFGKTCRSHFQGTDIFKEINNHTVGTRLEWLMTIAMTAEWWRKITSWALISELKLFPKETIGCRNVVWSVCSSVLVCPVKHLECLLELHGILYEYRDFEGPSNLVLTISSTSRASRLSMALNVGPRH